MKEITITKTRKETEKFAARFSRRIQKLKSAKRALVIGLIGNLGGGKTIFAKGFAKGLGIKEIVVSPTFVLMRIYALRVTRYARLIHIDAYRLEKSQELAELGFGNLLRDPRNIILIEWADRVKKILPKKTILIQFEIMKKNQRKIFVKNNYGER